MELAIRIMSDQLRYDGRSFYHNLSDVSMSMKLIYNWKKANWTHQQCKPYLCTTSEVRAL